MRRFAAFLLALALLAPVFGAGAVLADDLRDMAVGDTGLADDPATPGPDLYAPRPWGTDIPEMPSLLVLDAPEAVEGAPAPALLSPVVPARPDVAPCDPRPRAIAARGPPLLPA